MKSKLFIPLLVVIAITLLSSCNIYNPAEPVPAYIHIDNITVSIPLLLQNSANQGSQSSKISDAWIYVDEQLIGCFEMPCTVPVIENGTHTVKIKPGIKVNGIAATRAPYPFYNDYYQTVNLQPGVITTITGATVTYNPYMTGTTHFPLIEDFEPPGFNFSSTSSSQTPLVTVTSPAANVFEGTASAVGSLHSTDYVFECATIDSFYLNRSSAPVFLEFNYKCNQSFMASLKGYTFGAGGITNIVRVEALSFNKSESWNKEYLYLSPSIAQLYSQYGSTAFKVYFRMTNPDGTDSLGLALDNIKIVQ